MNPPNRRPIRGDRVNRLVSTWHCEPARGQQIRHHPTRPMHRAAVHSYQPTEPAHDVHEHRRRARPLPGKLAAAWRDPVAPDHSRCNTRIRPIPRAAAPAFQLVAGGMPIELETRAFDLLLVLLDADGSLVRT
jgi:hypothetical protein